MGLFQYYILLILGIITIAIGGAGAIYSYLENRWRYDDDPLRGVSLSLIFVGSLSIISCIYWG